MKEHSLVHQGYEKRLYHLKMVKQAEENELRKKLKKRKNYYLNWKKGTKKIKQKLNGKFHGSDSDASAYVLEKFSQYIDI